MGNLELYPWANAPFLWIRFGKRPLDSTELDAPAETRFDNYMANRIATVHALGSTWIVGLTMILAGL